MTNNKNVLITGASGFIGSFIVEDALSQGYKVWAGIRASSKRDYLQDSRISFIDISYSSSHVLESQLREHCAYHGKFDYIIHCAGITKAVHLHDFHMINSEFTVNLIDAIQSSNALIYKFIQMSSLSVLGIGDEQNETPFEATDTPKPNTAYGRSKLLAENHLKKSKLPYIILRPTGVYGPREEDYYMMLKSIKLGLNIQTGLKPQYLTFIYVKDLARLTLIAAESEITNNEYLVADGDTYTDTEYTNLIKKSLKRINTLNLRIPLFIVKIVSYISEAIYRIGGKSSTLNRDKYKILKQRNWKCDIQPIQSDFQFVAKYPLAQGLKESIEWYRVHGWL